MSASGKLPNTPGKCNSSVDNAESTLDDPMITPMSPGDVTPSPNRPMKASPPFVATGRPAGKPSACAALADNGPTTSPMFKTVLGNLASMPPRPIVAKKLDGQPP